MKRLSCLAHLQLGYSLVLQMHVSSLVLPLGSMIRCSDSTTTGVSLGRSFLPVSRSELLPMVRFWGIDFAKAAYPYSFVAFAHAQCWQSEKYVGISYPRALLFWIPLIERCWQTSWYYHRRGQTRWKPDPTRPERIGRLDSSTPCDQLYCFWFVYLEPVVFSAWNDVPDESW